jgi:predicted transposase/invertase (TIGR01784 family)
MNRFLKNPHDEFFKTVFSKKEVIRDFLKFIGVEVDYNSLTLLPTEKNTKYKKFYLDLAFKTKYKNKDAQVYILFEHKSYPDKKVYFQVLNYALSIWEKEEKLTPIIPIIFYHGKNFKIVDNFEKLFSIKTPYNLNYPFKVVNLNEIEDEKLLTCQNLFMCSALFTMKHIFDNIEKLKKVAQNFSKMSKDEYFLIIEYISAYKKENEEHIIDELIENKEDKVTILEKWIKEGMEKGLQQGLEQGLEQGLQQGLKQGIQEGIKIGEEKGILKGKILTMMEFGLKKEEIANKLNISLEKIEEILKG